MIALVLAGLLATAPDVPARENEFEAAFAVGVGARLALGGLVAFDTRWHAWGGPKISGGLELGLVSGYQHEPHALAYASMIFPSEVRGGNHRLQVLLTAGHGLRVMRLTVGTHLFVGWTQLIVGGRVLNATHDIDKTVNGAASEFTFGAALHARLRLTDALSLSGRVFLPVPNFATGANTTVMPSLGLSFRL